MISKVTVQVQGVMAIDGSIDEKVIAYELIIVFSLGQIPNHGQSKNWTYNLNSVSDKTHFYMLENQQDTSPHESEYQLEFSHSQ